MEINKGLKVSVIMPSYLYKYDDLAATDRQKKLIRAVKSFLNNTYPNKELIIIADGCDRTEKVYNDMFSRYPEIKFKFILRDGLFGGRPRNEGLKMATGELICYLDNDDRLTASHLGTLAHNFEIHKMDWCYYNDWVANPFNKSNPTSRNVELAYGYVGTSSIAHRRDLPVDWEDCHGYGHDFKFIQKLMKASSNRKKIYGCGYVVCHIRGKIDL